MMGTIRVDYDNARAEANKLLSAADDCERVVRQLRAASRSVPAEWEGAAADAFLIAVERRIAELQSLDQISEDPRSRSGALPTTLKKRNAGSDLKSTQV